MLSAYFKFFILQQTPIAQPLYPQVYLKAPAKIISFLLHPLFIPTYIFFWLTLRFPMQFQGISPFVMLMRKFNVFWMTAFFPAFAIFLLWRLKFIDGIRLRTQKDRIIPYIITMIFYWWMWYLSRNFTDQPAVLQFFYFGIFLTTIIALLSNIIFKISMHAMGVSGALFFVILTCLFYQNFLGGDLVFITMLAGAACTARLLLNEHTTADIYTGFFIGAFCQWAAYMLIM